MFNPIKQSHDYDPDAAYIKAWVTEVHDVSTPAEAFQYGDPIKKIEYKGNMQQRRKGGGGGGGRGGRGGGKYGGSSSSRGGGGGGGK